MVHLKRTLSSHVTGLTTTPQPVTWPYRGDDELDEYVEIPVPKRGEVKRDLFKIAKPKPR